MSWVELRERVRDSPERAFSLFTVRAAISSARSSERPCSFWLSTMCSYWRARLVPFLTPRGGMPDAYPGAAGIRTDCVPANELLDAGHRVLHVTALAHVGLVARGVALDPVDRERPGDLRRAEG